MSRGAAWAPDTTAPSGAAAPHAAGPDATQFLDDTLGALAAFVGIVRVDLPAPVAPVATLLKALSWTHCEALADSGALFAPPDGASFAGIGIAHRIRLHGSDRFARLRDAASSLLSSLEVRTHPACDSPPAPRVVGGLSFAVGGAAEGDWRAFGDGSFVLPRWTYTRDGARACLSFAGATDRVTRASAVDECRRILTLLASADEEIPAVDAARQEARIEQLSPVRWATLVDAARAAIAGGRFGKLVAARSARVQATGPIDVDAVLARLAATAGGCTLFAFREGGASFVGATPERLVALAGSTVRIDALAGSIAAGAKDGEGRELDGLGDAGRRLLGSEKDLAEHAFVVDEIARRIGPMCSVLELPSAPRIKRLRHLLHLHTPVAGTLLSSSHIVDLVEALHPTPAVGGLPTQEAIAWIGEHEPEPRGWYAAPVGWFDAAGDGEFVVALRSGLLAGDRALVYAGAGIVRASDPAAEYRETAWKQRSMIDALGIDASGIDAPGVTVVEEGAP